MKHLVHVIYDQKYTTTPELVVITSRKIRSLNDRIKQIVYPLDQFSHMDIYQRIEAGISQASHNTIFLAEHDVIYPKHYFIDGLQAHSQLAPDQVCYNMNVLTANHHGYFRNDPEYQFQSNLVGSKNVILTSIRARIDLIKSSKD